MEIIRCKKCGIEKELNPENFCFSTKGICKNKSTCRQCLILKHREYNKKNRELIIQKQRIYNARPEVKAHKRKYKKEYRIKNKEILKIKDKEYRMSARAKKVRADGERKRKQIDKVYYLKCYVRNIIGFTFKYKDPKICKKTEEITKLEISKLKEYLLETFKNRYGYEWDGKEKVDIDHIKPLILANTEEEVIEYCYYTNLQLLKKKDNAEKGTKYEKSVIYAKEDNNVAKLV